jgi:organic radical activating enzyme
MQPSKQANISEIFTSIQGEGILAGVRQLFVRFRECNLNCYYCDTKPREQCTDYTAKIIIKNPVSLSYVRGRVESTDRIHSVCFTGGEPLLYADFIRALNVEKPIYLETNMSLPEKAKKLRFVDYVAGDLKVRESGISNYDDVLEKTIKTFRILRNTSKRVTFCKIILPDDFDFEEIISSVSEIDKYVRCFVLQPVYGCGIENILRLQKEMMDIKDTRVIPQIHKYLKVR